MPGTQNKLTVLFAFALTLAVLVGPEAWAQAGPNIGVKSAAAEIGWYSPDLAYYAESEGYQLEIGGAPISTFQIEFYLAKVLVLRGSVGYWQSSAERVLQLDDELNARTHAATIRIVPLTWTFYYELAPLQLWSIRPVFGIGMTQNLVQRNFDRKALNREAGEEHFEGNGRGLSYHLMAGLHRPIISNIWLGAEVKWISGDFEETVDAGTEKVSLDGLRYGFSLRYRIR